MSLLVGAGGMILSFAKALKDADINYQQQLLVISCDIDSLCAFITYIQLFLYGIPAIVRCGNSLTNEVKFELKTYTFIMQYFKFRKFFLMKKNKKKQNIIINSDKKSEENKKLNEVTINGNCQISLW